MASIFTKTDNVIQKPPRNTFPMSYANNLTLKAGQLVPCYIQDVMPGDTARIDTRFGFQYMPMVFPVQTDMQCNVHFFYVRNRALWKGWENFITKTENLEGDTVPPFIQLTQANRDMFNTGDIGDYLGVPSVYYGASDERRTSTLRNESVTSPNRGYFMQFGTSQLSVFNQFAGLVLDGTNLNISLNDSLAHVILAAVTAGYGQFEEIERVSYRSVVSQTAAQGSGDYYARVPVMTADLPANVRSIGLPDISTVYTELSGTKTKDTFGGDGAGFAFLVLDRTNWVRYISGKSDLKAIDVISAARVVYNADSNPGNVLSYNYENGSFVIPTSGQEVHQYVLYAFPFRMYSSPTTFDVQDSLYSIPVTFDASVGLPNSMQPLTQLPFATDEDSNDARIRVSAMPFRAVEACYNAFYRDDRNNPLMIDGKPYYNVWVQNRDGGADTTRYTLYNKNWEQDVFTTAVQSPQQGIMPLVGVTASGNMTFADEDGKTYYMQAEFADDGKTITGISSYSSDMPAGTLRAMVDTISTGISINDFRNVNALQRWLETNMRKGLRYKDQIEAHFGTSPTYSELQMPEFIGGMSRSVHMSAVEQTVDTVGQIDGSPLGTLAGRASAVGEDGRPITHYCDEHGWIIGFVSITPRPVYSQTLNKMLTRTELLDYYFPEFGHIGFQPILNKELSPLQCRLGQTEDGTGTDDVFGYQRAWYEYLERYDEVHGDFRSTLRNFLIQRVFNGVPKLGKEFLLVGDKEVNEVFAVQDDSDKIFGQMVFDVVMKRPIPKFGIPKLEVG